MTFVDPNAFRKATVPSAVATLVITAFGAVSPAGGWVSFRVSGMSLYRVRAVALNVTAVNPDAAGFLSAFPLGFPSDQGTRTSVVNFAAGDIRPNLVIVQTGLNDEVMVVNGGAGAVDIIADVSGFFVE